VFLRWDRWHPASYILDMFGFRVVYDSGLSLHTKLASLIKNSDQFWSHARSDALVEIQGRLYKVMLGGDDMRPVWKSGSGKYSLAETWENLRETKLVVTWWKMVWFSMSIPRHAFLLWLTFRDALVTKQKMCSWGYSGRSLCLFCYGKQESREHLFFSCSFSQRIWLQLMADCSFTDVPVDWEFVESWGSSML
jgi:hypothetical protein